jgi:hypothetical protein
MSAFAIGSMGQSFIRIHWVVGAGGINTVSCELGFVGIL